MPGHGGWAAQELVSDAMPLRVTTDPTAKDGYGWLYAKDVGGVVTAFWMDDDGTAAPLSGTAGGFTPVASDPGSPVAGDVWFNTTDEIFRGFDSGGTFDFASERELDAKRFPGANNSAKINAAIAAAATGDTVTCERLSGVCPTTIIVNKKIKLKLGKALTLQGNPGIHMQHGTNPDGLANGAIIEGRGKFATQLVAATGSTGILVEADYAQVRDLGIVFLGSSNNNKGVHVQMDQTSPAPFGCVRPHLKSIQVQIPDQTSGSCFSAQVVFGGTMMDCDGYGGKAGWRTIFDSNFGAGVNALTLISNRFFLADVGMLLEGSGDTPLISNTTEGCVTYGLHAVTAFNIESCLNHWENLSPAANIKIDGPGDVFARDHTFTAEFFSGPPATSKDIIVDAGGTVNVMVNGGVAISGFTHNGTGYIKLNEVDSIGTNVGNVIVQNRNLNKGISTEQYRILDWQGIQVEIPMTINPFFGDTADLVMRGSSDSYLLNAISARDAVGIGALATDFIKLNVGLTGTFFNEFNTAINVLNEVNPSSNDTTGANAGVIIEGRAKSGNSKNISFVRGEVLSATHYGSGVVQNLTADEIATIAAGGDIQNQTGVLISTVRNHAGITTFATGADIVPPTVSAGQIVTFIGLYIPRPTEATFNAAIVTTGGDVILNQNSLGGSLIVVDNDTSYLLRADSDNHAVSIGASTSPFGKFTVESTDITHTGTRVHQYNAFTLNAGQASDANYRGLFFDMVNETAFDLTNSAVAINGDLTHAVAHVLNIGIGGEFNVVNVTTGQITAAEAVVGRIRNDGAGLIGTGITFLAEAPTNGGTYSEYYAFYGRKPSAFTGFTTSYGFVLEDWSGGTKAVWIKGGLSQFDGDVSLGGSGKKFGALGAAPVAQQASGADLTNNVTVGGSNDVIADFSDLTTYSNSAAAIRNDIYQLTRKVKQINDALRLYGLLT